MKHTTYMLLMLTLLTISFQGYAQQHQHGNRNYDKEKLESARIAFITNRLDLKPDQAEKFWPMFNQYNEKRTAIMESMSNLNRTSTEGISDSQAKELIKKRLANQQKLVDLEGEFLEAVQQVISPKQALQLIGVNREFTRQIYRSQQGGGRRK